MVLGITFFRAAYDTSVEERRATDLIGARFSEVGERLGEPSRIVDAQDFNLHERDDIAASFRPHPIPFAFGRVYIYNFTPTIMVIYERDGKVSEVYIGKT